MQSPPSLKMKKKLIFLLSLLLIALGGDYLYRYVLTIDGCPKCRQEGNRKYRGQYLEDYILSLVFADKKQGFYVDVGAAHPKSGSVTYFFYNKGWRGINIEPIKDLYDKLAHDRPRDINYNIGIAEQAGMLDFFLSTQDSGLSSFDAKENSIAEQMPVRSLTEILDENKVTDIDFLKIDVEGFERNVLAGTDLAKYRPKVILLEALEPKSLEPNHQNWEFLLAKANYKFVLFDGLNRFYLAGEHPELLEGFKEAYRCSVNIDQRKKILLSNPVLADLKE